MTMKNIYFAADHGGFGLKQELVKFLRAKQYEVDDLGPKTLVPDDDYVDAGIALGEKIVANPGSLGILLCRNGQGICVAANKVAGIRAVSGFSPEQAASTRTDDNANVLCLAADYLDRAEVEEIAERWLSTNFSGDDRHRRRIGKIAKFEQQR